MNYRERVIVALDTDTLRKAKQLVKKLKDSIKIFKVGAELFTACGPKVVDMVHEAGAQVFLDLKFHDIPNTVAGAARMAAKMGVFMFNVHISGGLRMLQEACIASAEEARKNNIAAPKLIGVTVLTSLNQEEMNGEVGIPGTVEETVLRYATLAQKTGLDGVVASAKEVAAIRAELGKSFMLVTPGIRPAWSEKQDQSRIVTPKQAFELGSDYIVVGRPITQAKNPAEAAQKVFEELPSEISH